MSLPRPKSRGINRSVSENDRLYRNQQKYQKHKDQHLLSNRLNLLLSEYENISREKEYLLSLIRDKEFSRNEAQERVEARKAELNEIRSQIENEKTTTVVENKLKEKALARIKGLLEEVQQNESYSKMAYMRKVCDKKRYDFENLIRFRGKELSHAEARIKLDELTQELDSFKEKIEAEIATNKMDDVLKEQNLSTINSLLKVANWLKNEKENDETKLSPEETIYKLRKGFQEQQETELKESNITIKRVYTITRSRIYHRSQYTYRDPCILFLADGDYYIVFLEFFKIKYELYNSNDGNLMQRLFKNIKREYSQCDDFYSIDNILRLDGTTEHVSKYHTMREIKMYFEAIKNKRFKSDDDFVHEVLSYLAKEDKSCEIL